MPKPRPTRNFNPNDKVSYKGKDEDLKGLSGIATDFKWCPYDWNWHIKVEFSNGSRQWLRQKNLVLWTVNPGPPSL